MTRRPARGKVACRLLPDVHVTLSGSEFSVAQLHLAAILLEAIKHEVRKVIGAGAQITVISSLYQNHSLTPRRHELAKCLSDLSSMRRSHSGLSRKTLPIVRRLDPFIGCEDTDIQHEGYLQGS